MLGLHYAIGITYRPPTPPSHHLSLSPQFLEKSKIGVRSSRSTAPSQQEQHPSPPPPNDRPISILHVPHGISYSTIHSYVINHLISEAALPLTALLHPLNNVPSSKNRVDVPSGVEIATKLAAKSWISTHDGDLVHRGLAKRLFAKKEKANILTESDIQNHLATSPNGSNTTTAVMILDSGEKTTLHSTAAAAKPETGKSQEQELQTQSPNIADYESESHNQQDNQEATKNARVIKVGSSDSGKGIQSQADVLMGSLEKCNWRSNLELFLQKEECTGKGVAKAAKL